MKLFKVFISILIVMLFANTLSFGQQQAQYSMYLFNPLVANPALAGTRDALSVTLLGRKQWVGVDGAPETGSLSIHSPLKNERVGVGFSALYDRIGPSQTISLFGDFAAKVKITRNSYLSGGVKLGTDITSVCYSCLVATHQAGPLASANIPNTPYFNFGGGLYWYSPKFFVGASVPKIFENKFEGIGSSAKQVRHYLLTGGYTFRLNSTLEMQPSFIVKGVANAPLGIDANLNFLFYEKLWIGAGYRFGDAIVSNLMFHFTPTFRAGYAYDYTISEFSSFNAGSHEIMINYDLDFLGNGIVTPRRF